jgi:selenide,water dikinase
MMTLNRDASRAALAAGIECATDITGYALLGHAYEMASASGVQFRFELARLPVLEGALALAKQGSIPGGTARNRDYLRDKVLLPETLAAEWEAVLFDPQTSGGLLLAVAPDKWKDLQRELFAREVTHWVIGHVSPGTGVGVSVF